MPRKILLVEDDEHALGLMAAALTKHGYIVSGATNTSQAKQLWTESEPPFDLLMTDVRLEEEDDGFMLADKLLAARPNVPVIFVSGDPDCFASPAIQRFGDSPFIRKPFDVNIMIASVKKVLANSYGTQG
jgi:two-component system, NtrC family, nitrogen regulation response regulator GlnG